jgi:hypothetical protein
MTESETQEPPTEVTTWDETKARAVAALDDARRAGFDMGEFICHVVTAAAANAGGAEELLSVRTGSWEAEYVRQIVLSTAGEDLADLLRHRTEPVRVYLPIRYLAEDLGLRDLADDERGPANVVAEALWDQVEQSGAWEPDPDRHIENLPEGFHQPLRVRSDLTPAQQAAVTAATDADDAASLENLRIEAMYEADEEAYGAALRAAVAEIVTERGLPAEVFEVVDAPRPSGEVTGWGDLGELLDAIEHEEAEARAVVPGLGIARRDVEGSVPDALRAAGLSYVQRLAAEQGEDQ